MNKEEIERGLIKELNETITANKCGLSTNDFSESIKILEGTLQYIEQLENKVEEQEKRPTFYYDNNRDTYVWCCRCSDTNMSLHMFLENGEIQQYASEHYDKWCKNTKEVKEIDVCKFMYNFVKPLIRENNNLKAKVKEQGENKQTVIEYLKRGIKEVEKCYEELLTDIGGIKIINISGLSKKEKEEVINKRNCLLVQKECYKEILSLLGGKGK